MFLSLLYTLFFLILDLLLFMALNKNVKLERYHWASVVLTVLFIVVLHSKSFRISSSLMPQGDFVGLLMFSVALIVLHFGASFQMVIINIFKHRTSRVKRNIHDKATRVFDVMRTKIIYIVIFLYQALAVWLPEIR